MGNGLVCKNNFWLSATAILVLFFFRSQELFCQACTLTFDSSTSATGNNATLSFPVTASGSNRLLVVQVNVEANDGASSITGVAYAGAPMSQVLQTVRSGGGGGRQATFIISAPALGTNNVVVSLAGGKQMEVGAIDYNGVDQTTPIGASGYVQDANAQDHSITLTTTTNTSLIASTFMWYPNNTTISSLGAGQTQRWTQTGANGAEGDDKIILIAGPATMSYTLANSKQADIQAIEIRPCGLVNTPTPSPTDTTRNTATVSPTATPTATLTHTPTSTGTLPPTSTPTFTPSLTSTPTLNLINSPTNTPVNTPTISITPTTTPTVGTPSPTLSFTPSPTPFPSFRVWPNPFTPELPTNNLAFFSIPAPHGVGQVMILDIRRRSIRTINFGAGITPVWDGKDNSGRVVRSGLYLYLLTVDGLSHRGSIAVLR